MKFLQTFGKYVYILMLLSFAWVHFAHTDYMIKYLPFPNASLFVMIVGIIFVVVALSLLIGKFDKLALVVLGVLLIVIAFSCHFFNIFSADNEHSYVLKLMDFMRIMMLAGSTLIMTKFTKDNRIVG